MSYEFKLTKRVEFSETDAAGLLHFSNYFRYMEMAEHAFFRSLGFSIHSGSPFPEIGWPRVHAECHYKQPLHFEDQVEIHLLVREKKDKSITYDFVFRKAVDRKRDSEIARGRSTAVCIAFDDKGKITGAISIPQYISEKIQEAPKELLD